MQTIDPDQFFRENLSPVGFATDRAKNLLYELKSGHAGLSTGINVLDRWCKFIPGELTILAARSSTGKTAIGMQIVTNVHRQLDEAKRPGVICIFSAEMNGETLMLREACSREEIPLWRVFNRDVTDEETARINRRLDVIGQSKRLYINESSAPTLGDMLQQLGLVEEEIGPIALVWFDYTELAGEMDRNEGQRIAKISRGLKAIAKKFHCPTVALSQLNRDIESRTDRTPTMRDLMHGGEREPDRIIMLVRPWLYDKSEPPEIVHAYAVKNRNGPIGDGSLFYDTNTMRFKSLDIIRTDLNED